VAVSVLGVAMAVYGSGLAACTGEASFVLPSQDAGAPSGRYQAVCNGWALRECAYTNACKIDVFEQWEDDAQ
jgi:hypothetical protein